MSSSESRPRRANAGRNIGKLVNQELGGDEFYSSIYGGFGEDEEDLQYETEGSDEDTVDSDFDVDESQWNEPTETEVEEKKRKKKEWVKAKSTAELKPPKPKKPRSTVTTMTLQTIGGPESLQRTFRKSTQHISQEYKKRFELEEEEQKRRKMYQARRAKPERKLTQKELLEEAKFTERENLSNLEAYSRLEAEKKKVEKKKVVFSGPVIRFHSMSMPFVTEINNKTIDHSKPPDTTNTNTNTLASTSVSEKSANSQNKSTNKFTRNFLVFTDTQGFPESYFPTDKPKYPRKRFCPVTGLPAKYVDPLTGTPYSTSGAFRVIRNRYVNEGEQTCERRLLQLSSWLLEKKRKKMEETL